MPTPTNPGAASESAERIRAAAPEAPRSRIAVTREEVIAGAEAAFIERGDEARASDEAVEAAAAPMAAAQRSQQARKGAATAEPQPSPICRTPAEIEAAARKLVRERGDAERLSPEVAERLAAAWAASERAHSERAT